MRRLLVPAVILLASAGIAPAQWRATPPDFVTPLTGEAEVPPRLTDATGQAQFRLINLGDTLVYRLIVDDIQNVVAAHIHLAPVGVNGPIVADLFMGAPGGGAVSGQIAEGIIESANLKGPLAGQSLSTLIEAMKNHGAYVNVHTNDGVDPTNTGAGDFPGGEIRGQIQRARIRSPRRTFEDPN